MKKLAIIFLTAMISAMLLHCSKSVEPVKVQEDDVLLKWDSNHDGNLNVMDIAVMIDKKKHAEIDVSTETDVENFTETNMMNLIAHIFSHEKVCSRKIKNWTHDVDGNISVVDCGKNQWVGAQQWLFP